MITELIKEYQNELNLAFEQIKLNKKIDEINSYLESKEKFSIFNFSLYKDLFIENGYSNEEIIRLDNNIKYIKIFINSDEFIEYDNFINALRKDFTKLNKLKKEINNQEELEMEVIKLKTLKDTLENTNLYIEDIDLIFHIFDHFNIKFKDIKKYMKEIIEHNKKVLELKNQDILLSSEDQYNNENEQVNNFLDKIINNINFNDLEKNILNKYYLKNKEEFEQKYNTLKNIKELNYIFKDIENNKKIFVVLMTLSNIDNINNVIGICNFRNLKVKKMLPNIFVSNGIKFNLDDLIVDDEYYSLFEGAYDNFINNLNYINPGLDLSKIEPTYYITDGNLIRNNHELLKEYGFNITIDMVECLTIVNLEDVLNKVIESGLYLYFKENPRKLIEIKDNAFFYRLKYAMNNPNITYKRKHLVKEIYMYNGYGITEDNYSDYIENYKIPLYESEIYSNLSNIPLLIQEIVIHPFIKILDELYLSDDKMSYNIFGFIVSRIKVIKLFNKYLKSVNYVDDNNSLFIGFMYAILNGLILKENETLGLVTKLLNKFKEYYQNELSDLSEETISNKLFNGLDMVGGL